MAKRSPPVRCGSGQLLNGLEALMLTKLLQRALRTLLHLFASAGMEQTRITCQLPLQIRTADVWHEPSFSLLHCNL